MNTDNVDVGLAQPRSARVPGSEAIGSALGGGEDQESRHQRSKANLTGALRDRMAGRVSTAGTGWRRRGMLGTGLIAGLVSSLCCLPAAVAFALGVSGASFFVGLGLYRPYFVGAGVGLAALAIWWSLRRSRRCCSPAGSRRNQILIPGLTLAAFLISYALINLVLLPWLYSLG